MPPPQIVRDGIGALYPPPAWVTGSIPLRDAEFLLDMVTAQVPSRVLEVGVAAGVSSAALLYALDTLPAGNGRRELYSCDVSATCYFNADYPTGGAVAEIYPSPHAHWQLETCDALALALKLGPESVDLTFIDANHSHPWPTVDLLQITRCAKPGSWVILHDINLPVLKPQFQVWGAKKLFDAWPFEKVAGGAPRFNVGAVKLPDDFSLLAPLVHALLAEPWEFPLQQGLTLPTWLRDIPASVRPLMRRCA